jgi:hypothetical protein
VQFVIDVPTGDQPQDVLAVTTGNLTLEQGVLLDDPSGHTTIGNAGSSQTQAGIDTVVGDRGGANPNLQACHGVPRPASQLTTVDVVSAARVSLEQGAEVTGGVLTTSLPSEQSGAKIDGAVTIQPGPFFTNLSWSVTFPATSAELEVDPGTTASLPPGAYDTVTVAQGATLMLTAGTYTFNSLSVDTGGTIQGNTASGPLVMYVQTSLHLYGSIVPSGGPSTLLLGYAGTSSLILESAFSGTFVAPNAAVTLASLANAGPGQQALGHLGAFFASSLDVHQCVNVGHAAFAGWSTLIPPGPPNESSPRALPRPPPAVGCYEWTANGWQADACMPSSVVQQLPPPILVAPQYTISSQPLTLNGAGTKTPIVFGQVETTFVSYAPPVSSESSVCTAECQKYDKLNGLPDPPPQQNAVSVQSNTNYFNYDPSYDATKTTTYNPLSGPWKDWVQFVVQTNWDGKGELAICLWQIGDVDLLYGTDYYTNSYCYGGQQPTQNYTPWMPERTTFQQFDFANVAGYIMTDPMTGDPLIGMVAEVNWVPMTATSRRFAVVQKDYYGLVNNWYDVGGNILGSGGGEQAQFGSTEIVTRVAASSCLGDSEPNGAICTSQSPLIGLVSLLSPLVPADAIVWQDDTTGESNNLQTVGTPTLVSLNADLVSTELHQSASTAGSCVGSGYAYIRDTVNDHGEQPSWMQGEDPWWESPDIFVLPHGSPQPGANDISEDIELTQGTPYDVWVRVTNLSCSQINDVKVVVVGTKPDVGLPFWTPITGGSSPTGYVYVDAFNNQGGAGSSINPFSQTMMGPYSFTPTVTDHRCLLAAVQASGESAVLTASNSPPAYQWNQIAQRNVQISSGSACDYSITNATGGAADLMLAISVEPATPAPGMPGGPNIELDFNDPSLAWYNTWNGQPGITVGKKPGGITTVTPTRANVALNTVTLPSISVGQTPPAVTMTLLSGPAVKVGLSSTLVAIPPGNGGAANILSQNGGTCQFTTAASSCGTGLTACGSTCVNLQTDAFNCGSCGDVCARGDLCSGGVCRPGAQ